MRSSTPLTSPRGGFALPRLAEFLEPAKVKHLDSRFDELRASSPVPSDLDLGNIKRPASASDRKPVEVS